MTTTTTSTATLSDAFACSLCSCKQKRGGESVVVALGCGWAGVEMVCTRASLGSGSGSSLIDLLGVNLHFTFFNFLHPLGCKFLS